MVKKELVKGTMLTALAALGISMSLSSGEFEVTAYAADNPAVVSAVADHTVGIPVGGEPGSWDCEPGCRSCDVRIYGYICAGGTLAVHVPEKTSDGRTGGVFGGVCVGAETAPL